jgi:integral membrane sensor domain MASE1
MQKGLGRMRRTVGWTVGGWLFVGLPMACAAYGFLAGAGYVDPAGLGGDTGVLFARWYPPGLVAASLLAYVTAKARVGHEGQSKRSAYFTLLVAPYALLMAYLIFKFEAPWLDDSLEDSIHALGEGAVVAQVALAFFCSGGSGS